MRIRPPHQRSILTQLIFNLLLVFVVALIWKSQAACPGRNSTFAGWPQDSIVRFDVSSLPPAVQAQAINALNAWNVANGQNNSGVTFVAADSQHPAQLFFQVGVPPSGNAAVTTPTPAPDGSEGAEVTINANNTAFFDPNVTGYNAAFFKAFLHEIGHTMGLDDTPVPNPLASPAGRCGDQELGASIMNALCGINDSGHNMSPFISPCDQGSVFQNPLYARQPCPNYDCNEGSGMPTDVCSYPGAGGCPPGYYSTGSCCQPIVPSPIVIDTDGSGFHFTSANDGVWFDFYGTGQPIKLSWTRAGSTNAWLVLDRNNNDTIDSAAELFGNYTAQPYSTDKNGFLALAEFDKSGAGGDEDGQITARDVVFNSLRLWRDTNHNGISEPEELYSLPELGLRSLSLDYREARRTDHYGNQFRYRAKVRDIHGAQLHRWAWDVFLVRQ